MEEQWYLAGWLLQARLLRRRNEEDEHHTCYGEPQEGLMRVEEANGNPRSQIQNVGTYYTYTTGWEDAIPRKKKSEKKNLNARTRMRKSGSAQCDRSFEC
jgi:hypothetical protein